MRAGASVLDVLVLVAVVVLAMLALVAIVTKNDSDLRSLIRIAHSSVVIFAVLFGSLVLAPICGV